MSEIIVEPVELWCWECKHCLKINVMREIANSSEKQTVDEYCPYCETDNTVRIPE